jgi:hypothetical protein
MPSKFYVVQKAGAPAIWQSDPQRILLLLRHKMGFNIASDTPSDTRADAPIQLPLLFPGSRPIKSS